MSKLLYTSDGYMELDSMGVNRWRELILMEFDVIAFAEYMGADLKPFDMENYDRQHGIQLNYALNDGCFTVTHMNDILDLIPSDRVKEFANYKLENLHGAVLDPAGRDLNEAVRKAVIFAMPMVVCQSCDSYDPSILYWLPSRSFRKNDIIGFLESHKVQTTSDIKTLKCASCKPRLYPSVYGSEWWQKYSNCDPRICRCHACE